MALAELITLKGILEGLASEAVVLLALATRSKWGSVRSTRQAIERTTELHGGSGVRQALLAWTANTEIPPLAVLRDAGPLADDYVLAFGQTLAFCGGSRANAEPVLRDFFRFLLALSLGEQNVLLDARIGARSELTNSLVRRVIEQNEALAGLAQRTSDALSRIGTDGVQGAAVTGEPRRRVIGAPTVDLTTFLGRETELDRLKSMVTGTAPPRVLQIVGKPGFGKSALASRLLLEAAGSERVDAVVFASSRDPRGLSFSRIATDLAPLATGDGAARILDSITAPAPVEAKAAALVHELRALRLVILLDDLDEFLDSAGELRDPEMRDVILAWSNEPHGSMVVLTAQVPLANVPSRIERLDAPLSPDRAVTVLRELLRRGGKPAVADAVLWRLNDVAGGVPRSLELVSRDDGIVAEAARVADTEPLKFRIATELLETAYRRLIAEEHDTIAALSVFRRPVTPAAVAAVAGRPVTDDVISRLVARDVVRRAAGGTLTLHPLDMRFMYGRLQQDAGKLQALECAAADWYRSRRATSWRSIEDVRPNLLEWEHSMRAAEYCRAVDIIEELDFGYLSLWGEWRRLLQMRMDIPAEKLDSRRRALTLRGIGAAHAELGEPETGLTWYERALREAERAGDEAVTVRILESIGMARNHVGDFARARPVLSEVLRRAEAAADPLAIGRAHGALGLACVGAGEYAEAFAHYDAGLRIGREIGDRRGVVRRLTHAGIGRLHVAQPDLALRHFDEASELALAIDDVRGIERLWGWYGRAWAQLGRFELALRCANLAEGQAARLLDLTGVALHGAHAAALLRVTGRHGDALLRVEKAVEIARSAALRRLESESLTVQGMILLERGETSLAVRTFDAALPAASELVRERVDALTGRARAALAQEAWETAIGVATGALDPRAATGAAAAAVIAARALLHLGRHEAAFEILAAHEPFASVPVAAEMALLHAIAGTRQGRFELGAFRYALDVANGFAIGSGNLSHDALYLAGLAMSPLVVAGEAGEDMRAETIREALVHCDAGGVQRSYATLASLLTPIDGGAAEELLRV